METEIVTVHMISENEKMVPSDIIGYSAKPMFESYEDAYYGAKGLAHRMAQERKLAHADVHIHKLQMESDGNSLKIEGKVVATYHHRAD